MLVFFYTGHGKFHDIAKAVCWRIKGKYPPEISPRALNIQSAFIENRPPLG